MANHFNSPVANPTSNASYQATGYSRGRDNVSIRFA